MTMLTVRDLNEEDKRLLRIRAASNGRSMSAEVRAIIHDTVREPLPTSTPPQNGTWPERLLELGQSVGGVELEIPPRDQARIPELP
ncbi:FitA-like ribbon-helix-helix domain-containing protein [Mobiluncus mulieris]|uniref:FitA-like ribbon-helix-helix domain-containing protein n=1 Tax=Mobiluncus mulieris TaxID=2052 RepID=UPI002431704A|nr:hypothetical protein [Mobiluncus mulieris]